ncbi:CotY/CotZ family spore coat protein [Bacillus sp. Marseille-Q1617]|uniref:CotY/CotZ family spore coat protein n=1 Tax=Bacillus sp. Marseille-Q1617 TaxID=2736887 RepID=UPI0020CA95FA|nr:CotY/CotZ family spore coat protein [Bacillus sp. Marseille-Q1617]
MICHHNSCICETLNELLLEQCKLATQKFKFICEYDKVDTIPFLLYMKENSEPFEAHLHSGSTIFFKIIDIEEDCATLRLLEGVDIDGYMTDDVEDIFALYKTDKCIIIDCNCILGIQPLPPKLVNRKLPEVNHGDGQGSGPSGNRGIGPGYGAGYDWEYDPK